VEERGIMPLSRPQLLGGWLGRLVGRTWVERASASAAEVPPLGRWPQLLLWLLLVAFAFSGVFGHSLWGGNDSREGGMIWDMYRHGTWVTPTINGKAFLEKPPLLHWTSLAFCHLTGRVTEGLVRLPAALYGFGTLVLIYLFVTGARTPGGSGTPDGQRQLAAWAAVFLCATAIEFQEYSRIVLTDIALTFMVILSLFLFWRAYLRPGAGRWLAFLVAAAGAFYAKGLIGPALVWSAVGVFLFWKRRLRLLAGLAGVYVPVLLILVLPWVVALLRFAGEGAVRFVFWDNQVGRFFHFRDSSLPNDPFFVNKEPVYYYLANLPLYIAPWTLLLVPAFVAWWRRSSPFREPFHVYINSALAGMFLLLHASSSKVVSYALPVYPFLFMMVGIWLAEMAWRPYTTALERLSTWATAWALVLLCGTVPVLYVAAAFVRPDLVRTGGTASTVAGLALAGLIMAFVAIGVVKLRALVRTGARPVAFVLAPAAYALAVIGILQLVTPPIDRGRTVEPIASLAAEHASRGRVLALACGEERDVGAFTFYLDRRLPLLAHGVDVRSFLADPEPRAVIALASSLPELRPLLTGLEHDELVAGLPDTVSGSFVLLVNRPGEEFAGTSGSGATGGPALTARNGVRRGLTARIGGGTRRDVRIGR
jgi:4-amino-4-deoxy-L-arabinose transferase-like glycosyltransferase